MKEQIEQELLDALAKGVVSNTWEHVGGNREKHEILVGVIKSLQVTGHVMATPSVMKLQMLTQEGEMYRLKGSPEVLVFNELADGPKSRDELVAKLGDVANVGWSLAMKKKFASIDKETKSLKRATDQVTDDVQAFLQLFAEKGAGCLDKKVLVDLKKRKMYSEKPVTVWSLKQGVNFSTAPRKKAQTDLTADMLKSGSWEQEEFKEYNFEARGPERPSGALHPLLKIRAEFRSILMEMGFEEMPTNRFVESSFWNFDALFQPQQHPARDSHDTFFIKEPSVTTDFNSEYLERVKNTHEKGGYGSVGYRYNWKIAEAQKNILRTHTTAVSSRMLYQLAESCKASGVWTPKRYFSIDRVFRNETLDMTHLAEFHQVEGLVADYNLTLGDLIGTIETFFKRIGISDLRFKPAYNPYTEPSMEIFGFSQQLGKWIEVGNSGIFRPEMLRPMGIPEGVNVIAWGLSLERPTMIKYGIGNIRTLFGPKVNLNIIAKAAIARFD